MGRFWRFLYQTFINQEKNRRDVLDYLRAASIITLIAITVWVIAYYGLKGR